MEYFNRVFFAISMAVVLASLLPYADALPHGEGLQTIQNQGYNWHQRQESPQLPYKETTAQRVDLQNKRSDQERLQRWQIENWPNDQQFEKEKYRRPEEIVKQDETQKQKEWQVQQQKQRKQQTQDNLNWQQSQAIPLDSRPQYSRWQNIPQLHQAQGQPIIPQGGAHKYYYPDKQLRYYPQGEWPRPYTYQAPALHPEIYHNTREFPFPPGHPEYETNKNAYAENQQVIYDKEDGSKVQITHIPKLNTPGSKLIPPPFPYNVANTHVGSQKINEQQKLTNSNIQLVKKRQDIIRSDADAIVENRYQQDLKRDLLRREPQERTQLKPKQSLIDEQTTEARIEYKPSSEPNPVNNQSRLTAETYVKYNNLNQIQKNREYGLLNRQLQPNKEKPGRNEPKRGPKEAPSIIESPKDEKQQTITPQEQEYKTPQTPTTDSNDDLSLVVGQTNDQNEDRKLVPQKPESNDQVAEKNDTTQPRKNRRNRRRRQKPPQYEKNNKQIETAIEKLTVGEETSKMNAPAEKLFDNPQRLGTQSAQDISTNQNNENEDQNQEQTDTIATDKIENLDDKSNSVEPTKNMQSENSNISDKTNLTKINDELNDIVIENNDEQDETASKEKNQSDDEPEQSNNDTNDTGEHKNDNDSKDNDDQKTKLAPDDYDSDDDEKDEPKNDHNDSKDNEDQKIKITVDDDDDFIDGDEPNDGDNDFKGNEHQKTKVVFNDAEDDSAEKDESDETVTDTKTDKNGQDDESINAKEFVLPDHKDDVTTIAPAQPIENVWYAIVDYYYGDDSLTNKTINTDPNEDKIPTIDIANVLAAEIINSLIPSNYANTFNFIRIIATNAMRGRDGLKDIIKEPVIKGYVSQITEKIIPLYLKVKSFVEPEAYRDCKRDEVVPEELDV